MEQNVTNITNFGLLLTVCLGILILKLPKRYALVPLLISGCYMTLGQSILVGGLHFTVYRILILTGLIRIFIRKEIFDIKLNHIDKVLIVWILVRYAMNIALRGTNAVADDHAGFAYGILGTYFIIRAMLRNIEDVIYTVNVFAIIVIPLAVIFVYEMETGKNIFSVFGGVSELSEIRDGRIRCQGPFRHPILAGTFGATTFPLLIGLWKYETKKHYVIATAILSSTIIVICSASSGPLLAYLAGIAGLLCWRIRSHMRAIRWGSVVMILGLHAVMKAPVWFLIARLGDIVGGGGYHRATLIDAAIKHYNEWWLIGTTYTAHWMPTGITADPNMADITNQFIVEGVNGGIITMGLFIWLIAKCFKKVGIEAGRNTGSFNRDRFMIWSMGCVVLSHVVSMFSVAYFDQIIIFWCLIIAMIAGLNTTADNSELLSNVQYK
jgi:hypothetical protein